MAITKSKKQETVQELTERFKKAKITLFSDFHGTSVSKLQSLRRTLRGIDAEYKVAKKTLLSRAAEEAGVSLKTKELQGEIGITFGYGDEVIPAKTLVKFGKENETFKVLGGILGARVLHQKDVAALAKLPAREVLLAHVASTMQAPIRGLAVVLQANMRNLVVVLQKIKNNKT